MLRRVYHSQQAPPAGLNRVLYRNPDVDRLIEQAALPGTDDGAARALRPRRSS